MYVVIELGEECVAGDVGDFILLPIPDHVRHTSNNEPTFLQWINTLNKMKLTFHGLDNQGSAVFRIS
ncbi:hypothetical protein vB_PsyM_KIL3b_0002 [Pseudomonas phage vB_PsyM_KIL3b]|uniref:Uncharacterized protein n=4 Tax=Pseudomonas phage vB_PsyM_KIL1 TaxID=1777065 RepID=A0A142IDV8_9CAUD|nr:hypothetical protein BH774_gp002 [Pseudomonas phage vB_PsyM_KIL1]AMR57254.1 hypothetical protein vB_PsyM_KIL1_0002 [Pseudomonas phage vB_PsyM_KIL1]AMR57413.1 hypothetical protein vB_PsyM_KIL2_0002 [Pseudomonas phage vB_PsyM_KIL2]AMR57574.1 hypothetical protein vB_PsyM_KIL3_0002 [Pseudomonas phage vB_PsyM_KIL3]AMR58072.1 hypothetical protein vB_PsyM_KIL3b_0002 [Pseudomonas phage vB_PsyM_KIL3b]